MEFLGGLFGVLSLQYHRFVMWEPLSFIYKTQWKLIQPTTTSRLDGYMFCTNEAHTGNFLNSLHLRKPKKKKKKKRRKM